MSPYYNPEHTTLTQSDISRAVALYGARTAPDGVEDALLEQAVRLTSWAQAKYEHLRVTGPEPGVRLNQLARLLIETAPILTSRFTEQVRAARHARGSPCAPPLPLRARCLSTCTAISYGRAPSQSCVPADLHTRAPTASRPSKRSCKASWQTARRSHMPQPLSSSSNATTRSLSTCHMLLTLRARLRADAVCISAVRLDVPLSDDFCYCHKYDFDYVITWDSAVSPSAMQGCSILNGMMNA